MKSYFWCSVSILTFTICSASSTCTEERSYRYEVDPHNLRCPQYPFGPPRFRICSAFSPRRYRQLLNSITVTCSNISSNVDLNYTQQYTYHPHDLVIKNSVIPKLPSNSSLSRIVQLRKLVLKGLSIHHLQTGAFDGLNYLQTLDLSFNKLEEIPFGVFDHLSNLINLDLSNNLINQLEEESISGLVTLKELYLNRNNLTVLVDDVFNDTKSLEILDVSDNPLDQFPNAKFGNLKKLLLKNTRLRKFDANLTQSPLSHVDISGSHLETINFDNFPSFEKLILSRNHIKVVQNWDKLHGGEVLLDHNNITEVKFPYSVKILDLSHNQIKLLENEYLHTNNSIKILDLAFNEISVIPGGIFWNFVNLEVLYVKHNNITTLNRSTFLNCFSLKTVDLSYNNIQSIDSLAFQHTDHLNFLNISHNHLTTVSTEMLTNLPQLRNLYIDNNEIVWFEAGKFDNPKTLSMNENSWPCEVLSDILHTLRIGNVDVIDATSLDGDNVDGIACVFDKKS